jgi:hypothetical protein
MPLLRSLLTLVTLCAINIAPLTELNKSARVSLDIVLLAERVGRSGPKLRQERHVYRNDRYHTTSSSVGAA